jgi:hypothetical protein
VVWCATSVVALTFSGRSGSGFTPASIDEVV